MTGSSEILRLAGLHTFKKTSLGDRAMRRSSCSKSLLVLWGTFLALAFMPRTSFAADPAYYRYSVRHEKGASAFYPFTSLGRESVNSANGNLFFAIPLVSRPGRNGLRIDLKL